MKNKKLLIQLLALGPVIFVPAIVLFVGTLIMDAEEENYQKSISQIEHDFVETEKSRILSKVNNIVDFVSYRHSIINKQLHSRIQKRVDDAQRVALTLHGHYADKLPEEEIKKLITDSLRPLEWNGGESYIWIIDYDGKLQLGPGYLKEHEGQSIIEFEDSTGRKIIQEEIAITKEQGKGFLWDSFTKPGKPKDKQFKQLAFVKALGVYDWYLGSAEFLDTATRLTNVHLLEAINQVGKGDSDYVFVIDTDGNLLLNYARPDIVGRNMSETKDPNLHALYQRIVRAAKSPEEEFISYNWLNPRTGMVDAKMAYIKAVPGSKMIIGSGFYPSMLERGYDAQKQRLNTQFQQKMRHFNALTWLSVMGALLLATLMSAMFYRTLSQYQRDVVENNNELKTLNIELEQKVIDVTRQCDYSNKQLANLQTIDKLTQVTNRDTLLRKLRDELERAQRYKTPLSVVKFDLDHFKRINEEYGVQVGDEVLKELAQLINRAVRSIDSFGRLSAGEFLILMPEVAVTEGFNLAERLRELIDQNAFTNGLSLTSSFGVTEYHENEEVSEILKRVDAALNRAKQKGRNQTYVVDGSGII